MMQAANSVSGVVVDAAMKVHSALGPGLLESAYVACLAHELRRRGVGVDVQVPVPLVYEGVRLDVACRIDMLVERLVVVEAKTVEKILPVHIAQLLSYLRLGGCPIGLLFNFHAPHLRDGIRRLIRPA